MSQLTLSPNKPLPLWVKGLCLASSILTLAGCSTLSGKMPWSDSEMVTDDALSAVNTEQAEVVVEPVTSPESVVLAPDEDSNAFELFKPSSDPLLGMGDRPSGVRNNIFDTMTSNFSDYFQNYDEVERRVLIFPNDSLRLGETNKQIIEQYVEMMDTSTDVLSVIGCSHGTTDINNGNSLLALGRANRVKEAFLFSGVEHDSVLEEGCWAPTPFEGDLPDRGVVVTLKRRKSS